MAVSGNRLFVTSFETYRPGEPKESATILGHCLDARTGRILWSVRLIGSNPSPLMYAYSDATSWTPVTDGRHVWFFNAAGAMGCWDFEGREVWRREFPSPGKPFNKQHEPILYGDTLITLEPAVPGGLRYSRARSGWHYLRGLDKRTGKTLWIAEDPTTFYCTSVLGFTRRGVPAVIHGRGGPHDVPERPIGLSLTSLEPGAEGKTLWRYLPEELPGGPVDGTTFQALYTMSWTPEAACWFRNAPEESHLVLDADTGRLLRSQSLTSSVDFHQWIPDEGRYRSHRGVNLRAMQDYSPRVALRPGEVLHVFPNWHSNLVTHGYHYFLTSTGHRRNSHAPPGRSGPSHCVGRVNLETGRVEYLELPVSVERTPGRPDRFLYNLPQRTTALDNLDQDVAAEDRSRTDGWQIPAFFPSPICIGNRLYFTTMLGLTYVIQADAPDLAPSALLAVNDLGDPSVTWSLSALSYSRGKLYHRSLREVVCIGR